MERADLARLLGGTNGVHTTAAGASVVMTERPEEFMPQFSRAVTNGGAVFLADPTWGPAQRRVLDQLVAIAGDSGAVKSRRGWLMIPSGGTSGSLKFARHDEKTIAAAVRGFSEHFGLSRVNAVGMLPMHHVSGLMAWMRCALTGGTYLPWDWAAMKEGRRPTIDPNQIWVLSLVPTQLQRLLENPEAVRWLRQFKVIFVGGGPTWPALAEAAARAELPISLSYGMTETAAMVTALRPSEFLAGARSSGATLPHARVSISREGTVSIEADSVFRGYYPDWRDAREFQTEDLGEIDVAGALHVQGRRDALIITGGKKVEPAVVEALLRASGEFGDVAVIGVPDAEWGQAVVACYPIGDRAPDLLRATRELSGAGVPKRFYAFPIWPRNAQGKINRAELLASVTSGALEPRG